MHSDEPETGEASNPRHVFEALSDDVDQCFERVQQDLYSPDENGEFRFDQANARSYARAAFACIEGFACFMVPPAGRVLTTSLDDSVRSMFALMDRAHPIEPHRDTGQQWWAHFLAAIKIRDRLAYPKSAADLDVSHADLMTIIDADAGFRLLLSRYLEESLPPEPLDRLDG
jgi:hypothetical protein